jgi:hypothetical protein
MAGPHLERLRAQKSQKRAVEAPSKPSKLSFEGFEGDQSKPFLENNGLVDAADVEAKNSKNATSAHSQNLQNLHSPSDPVTPLAKLSDVGCKITVVKLPAIGLRYRRTFAHLQLRPAELIPVERWQEAVEDGRRFLATWERQAGAFGWDPADLFGLHTPPANPHPSYRRLSRYDQTGLVWVLQGRDVIALTEATATIRNPATGSLTTYRRFNNPALGPNGGDVFDIDPWWRQ